MAKRTRIAKRLEGAAKAIPTRLRVTGVDDPVPPPEASNGKGIEWARGNPARRCVATRRTGVRCRNWAIRGGTVCRYHGGSTAHIKRKAKERLDRDQDLATMRAIVRRTLGDLAIPAGKARNAFAARLEALPPPAQPVCEVNIDGRQDTPTPEPPQDNVIEQHRARHGLPADEPLALPTPESEVMDAEVVPEPELHTYRPSAAVEAAERPGRADAPGYESAAPLRHLAPPPVSVTYEEAGNVMRASRGRTDPVRRRRQVRRQRVRW